MYWSGWEMGAVEAISLSILVGSSVDYCVHLVEGYLLAGENLPSHQAEVRPSRAAQNLSQDPSSSRAGLGNFLSLPGAPLRGMGRGEPRGVSKLRI